MQDTKSIIGFQLFTQLSRAFGAYYVWIFSPVLILLSVFLLKEKNLYFNTYRAFGLLFFYVSTTTLIGWYITDYEAIFNLYPSLENVLGRMPLLFCNIILLSLSLYILFRFSVLHASIHATKSLPKITDITETYKVEKKLAKAKKTEKYAQSKSKKLHQEEKKIAQESSQLEKQLEALRQEKEQLAKMKQPKQLKLEKQKNRKIEVTGKSSGGKIASLFGV